MTSPLSVEARHRNEGARLGSAIGDALAMPVHWIYDREALRRDYGRVSDFLAPKSPHPDSILWRSTWQAPNPALDILGTQRALWGRRGVHYHQNLQAGENTLTLKLAARVWDLLTQTDEYDPSAQAQTYIDFLLAPEIHRDTYIEECHRGFFTNLGRGHLPEKCGVAEKHIGGLVLMLPVALFFARNPEQARRHALEHLALTHPGKEMRLAGEAILTLLFAALQGKPLAEAIREEWASQKNRHFAFPFFKWLERTDEAVIGGKLSTACYVDQAVPAVIYLALKYAQRPEAGLIANTNLGGDNVHRGGVLGALLGAANGVAPWPSRWVNGLLARPTSRYLLPERINEGGPEKSF